MSETEIRDMLPADECYVSTCTHVNESPETDACGEKLGERPMRRLPG